MTETVTVMAMMTAVSPRGGTVETTTETVTATVTMTGVQTGQPILISTCLPGTALCP